MCIRDSRRDPPGRKGLLEQKVRQGPKAPQDHKAPQAHGESPECRGLPVQPGKRGLKARRAERYLILQIASSIPNCQISSAK